MSASSSRPQCRFGRLPVDAGDPQQRPEEAVVRRWWVCGPRPWSPPSCAIIAAQRSDRYGRSRHAGAPHWAITTDRRARPESGAANSRPATSRDSRPPPSAARSPLPRARKGERFDSRAAQGSGSAGLARRTALCFPVPRMLDPRILATRRDEIVESCRRRRVTADVDAAIRAQERLAAAQTELGEANRRRNEHQAAGKRKLESRRARGARRRGAAAEGRGRGSRGRGGAGAARARRTRSAPIPNLVHPETPEGGEADFRELRRVGTPRQFSFAPLDHVTLGEKLALDRFRSGRQGHGPEVLLPEERGGAARAGAPAPRARERDARRLHALRDARSGAPERGRWPRLRAARRRDADLHDRGDRSRPDRHGRDHAGRPARGRDPRRGEPAAATRGRVALLPHRGGRGRAREPRALPRAPVHEGRDVRDRAPGRLGGAARRDPRHRGSASSRRSRFPTA